MYQFHQEQHFCAVQEHVLKVDSWVMTAPSEAGFVKLPNERILYTSSPRTQLQISTPNTFPAAQPLAIKSDAGIAYITTQRIVYLPTTPTPDLQSFSSPILNLNDTFVRAPFFGANYWIALCKPVSGGGIPAHFSAVALRLTFREGGAFDFHMTFEQIKERLYQAVSVARESSGTSGVNLANVHLEQLPAYEPAEDVQVEGNRVEEEEDEPVILSPRPVRPGHGDGTVTGEVRAEEPPNVSASIAPDEPPPGYEEAQAQAVGEDLEQRLRNEVERRRSQPDP